MFDFASLGWGFRISARLRAFRSCQDGAVTVDWVVLTGALVGLSLGVLGSLNSGLMDIGDAVNERLSQAEVTELGTINDW